MSDLAEFIEAEPLVLKRDEVMKAREKSITPQSNTRIPEALDSLIELYAKTDKPEEVKNWVTVR